MKITTEYLIQNIYDIDMYNKQLSSLVGLEQGPDDNLVTQHS